MTKPIVGDVLDGQGLVLLSREAIIAAADVAYETVDVPEWGGRVRLRSLTGTERDAYDAETWMQQQGGAAAPGAAPAAGQTAALANFRARRLVKAIVDGDGNRVFTDSPEDIAFIGSKNGAVIDRLDDVVIRLSGMKSDAVERATTDLKAVASDGSGSD